MVSVGVLPRTAGLCVACEPCVGVGVAGASQEQDATARVAEQVLPATAAL